MDDVHEEVGWQTEVEQDFCAILLHIIRQRQNKERAMERVLLYANSDD